MAEKEAIAQDTEEAQRKKELEAEERRQQSHDMVAESIRRELAASVCPLLVYTDQTDLAVPFRRGEGRRCARR